MNQLIAFCLIAISSFAMGSDKAVIQQMKGRRAIVLFEKDIPFSVGQKIFINSADGSELGIIREARNPLERKNLINLSSSFTSLSQKPKSLTTANLEIKYGWNKETHEFGPVITFNQRKQGSSEVTVSSFGAYFDYNLIPNRAGEDFIWGATAQGGFGTTKSSGTSTSTTTITAGAFGKWFIFSPMLALRAEFFVGNQKIDKKGYSYNGISIGLNHYF